MFILKGILELLGGCFDSDEDQMSVLLNTYSARLRVHVVIYINKLFSAEDQHDSCKSLNSGFFFADLDFEDCCDQSEHADAAQWLVKLDDD